MYFEELLNKVTEPADLAVFFLGFSAGFIIDSMYFSNGAPAGTIAGIIAIGVLGTKKGVDAYLSGSSYMAERRRKKKLSILRRYFSDNPRVLQQVNEMENILKAQIVDYTFYDLLLQRYIVDSLQKADEFKGKQQNINEDFQKLYCLAKSPEENKKELEDLCKELENLYFPPEADPWLVGLEKRRGEREREF